MYLSNTHHCNISTDKFEIKLVEHVKTVLLNKFMKNKLDFLFWNGDACDMNEMIHVYNQYMYLDEINN